MDWELVSSAISAAVVVGTVIVWAYRVGRRAEGQDRKIATNTSLIQDVAKSYKETCSEIRSDVADIKQQVRDNATAVQATIGNIYREMNSATLDHERRISIMEGRLNAWGKREQTHEHSHSHEHDSRPKK